MHLWCPCSDGVQCRTLARAVDNNNMMSSDEARAVQRLKELDGCFMQPSLPENFAEIKLFIMGSYHVNTEADGSPLARSGEVYTAHTAGDGLFKC